MRPTRYTMAASILMLALTSGCTLHHYDPALPAERTTWEKSPLGTPPEDVPQTAPTSPSLVPPPEEWAALQVEKAPHTSLPPLPGKRQAMRAPGTEMPAGTVVTPTSIASSQSAMRRYSYAAGKVYDIHTAPHSPTYVVLPPGERLAGPVAINSEAWAVGVVQMGTDANHQEAVVVRPLSPGQETTTALLFQSGLIVFCRLRSFSRKAMVAVTWDLPPLAQATAPPELPVTQRPPTIDRGRLHTGYQFVPYGNITPPWQPVSVFDDGSKTYVRFREALTYTRAPGVYGVYPTGAPALVQSHMFVTPGQPERGAWLIVNGLWPALELKDAAGLAVRIVRQAPQTPPAQEGTYAPR